MLPSRKFLITWNRSSWSVQAKNEQALKMSLFLPSWYDFFWVRSQSSFILSSEATEANSFVTSLTNHKRTDMTKFLPKLLTKEVIRIYTIIWLKCMLFFIFTINLPWFMTFQICVEVIVLVNIWEWNVSSLYKWFSTAVKSMGYGQILTVRPYLSCLGQAQFPHHNNNTMILK